MAQVKFDKKAAMAPLMEAEKRLVSIGFQLEGDIKRSMTTGTGRVYVSGKNRNIIHIASVGGAPPAVDTGRLRASISTNWSDSSLARGNVGAQADTSEGVGRPEKHEGLFRVVVGSNVLYAPLLEFGTRKMAARPFIRPAWDRLKNRIARMIVGGT